MRNPDTARKWNSSEKGRASRAIYQKSKKGKATALKNRKLNAESLRLRNREWRAKNREAVNAASRRRGKIPAISARNRESGSKRRRDKIQKGICPRCSRPLVPGRSRCQFHLDYAAKHKTNQSRLTPVDSSPNNPAPTSMSHAKLQPMVAAIIAAICPHTKNPRIEYLADSTLEISGVHAEDEGRLIGKRGTIFWALTAIHFYACRNLGVPQVRVLPLETDAGRRAGGFVAFRPKEDWDCGPVAKMTGQILSTCFESSAWALKESVIKISLPSSQLGQFLNPSFAEAIDALIHSAGKACGANLKTEVAWV